VRMSPGIKAFRLLGFPTTPPSRHGAPTTCWARRDGGGRRQATKQTPWRCMEVVQWQQMAQHGLLHPAIAVPTVAKRPYCTSMGGAGAWSSAPLRWVLGPHHGRRWSLPVAAVPTTRCQRGRLEWVGRLALPPSMLQEDPLSVRYSTPVLRWPPSQASIRRGLSPAAGWLIPPAACSSSTFRGHGLAGSASTYPMEVSGGGWRLSR
jgi:hypothetical protein